MNASSTKTNETKKIRGSKRKQERRDARVWVPTAILNNVKIAPRKLRIVADLIRGKLVQQAIDELTLTNRKGARILHSVLKSAIANATSKSTVDVDRLRISELTIDMGPCLKRFVPRAQGRATPIKKKMSHVTLKVKEI
jgi:large subunit ribosomal protein L22